MRCPHCGKEIYIYDFVKKDRSTREAEYKEWRLWNSWCDFTDDDYPPDFQYTPYFVG